MQADLPPLPEPFATIDVELWGQNSTAEVFDSGDMRDYAKTYGDARAAQAAAEEREACAQLLLNGSFLHADAPAARFAREAAKAIRARAALSQAPAEHVAAQAPEAKA
jgi:hypothetical protein